ncbi:hypothetical protein U1Q18_040522 [Sarracenia purpurea var. burkii]
MPTKCLWNCLKEFPSIPSGIVVPLNGDGNLGEEEVTGEGVISKVPLGLYRDCYGKHIFPGEAGYLRDAETVGKNHPIKEGPGYAKVLVPSPQVGEAKHRRWSGHPNPVQVALDQPIHFISFYNMTLVATSQKRWKPHQIFEENQSANKRSEA